MSRVLPILFNTDMVRAILDGRKTVTRRLVKFVGNRNPNWTGYIKDGLILYNGTNEPCNVPCRYRVGDILYVRETWSEWTDGYLYKAWNEPFPQPGASAIMKWHPSIHMPKEAARIFLKVKDVRVERLQAITEQEARKEGFEDDIEYCVGHSATINFAILWDTTIKKADRTKYGWKANPWVWVIEFERCEKPEEW